MEFPQLVSIFEECCFGFKSRVCEWLLCEFSCLVTIGYSGEGVQPLGRNGARQKEIRQTGRWTTLSLPTPMEDIERSMRPDIHRQDSTDLPGTD